MTDQQKLDNYKNYVNAEVEMGRIPMGFEHFIESLMADDNCENCKKLGETTCGNDVDCRCFEPKQ